MADEVLSFCKIDVHLDTNPKVRKAGRDGRDVFEFVVRRNSLMANDGSIPLKYIEPWYLADVLMMSETEASNGVSRAVTAALLELDEAAGVVRIVGWTHEWGRRPLTNGERQEAFRMRKAAENVAKSNEHTTRVTASNGASRPVTDVTDQRRSEEIRGEEISEKNSARPPAGGSASDSPGLFELKAKVDAAVASPAPRRKPKPFEASEPELAAVRSVLERLTKRNGVRYSRNETHIRLIVSRLREGCTEHDLRKIIAYVAEPKPHGLGWADGDMVAYLRPETLFGPENISKYLDPARSWFEKQFSDEEQSA